MNTSLSSNPLRSNFHYQSSDTLPDNVADLSDVCTSLFERYHAGSGSDKRDAKIKYNKAAQLYNDKVGFRAMKLI